jgi:hypothetical protein
METMRESWTDERLDDLKQQMTEGFARLDTDIRELRRMMLHGLIVMIGIMVTGFLSLASLIVF